MSSVDYSLENPQDPFVQKKLDTTNHNGIMSKIDKNMAPHYDQLAQEFCIAQNDITTITATALTKVNGPWHGLNAVVDTWLRGNYDGYGKVQPNERWLVDAVTKIDPAFGKKLAKEYGITISSENPPEAKRTPGLEEPDSGPPDVEKYCPPLDNKIGPHKPYEADLTKDINIVIVTATDTEYQAVMGQAKPMKDGEKYIQTRTNGITFNVVMYGNYKVAIIRTGQGKDKTMEKLQKIQKVVNAQYVIAIGVCYGMKEGKKGTNLGSILVSKRVKIISTHAFRDDEDVLNTEDRNSGDTLYDIFESHHGFALDDDIDYKVNIKTGDDILVTEDSLVTSQDRKNLIEKKVAQALGGEMEAAAILQKDVKFEGIVIKAIADWGDMEKASCSQWKGFSAYAAAKYVWYQLSSIPEDELKTN